MFIFLSKLTESQALVIVAIQEAEIRSGLKPALAKQFTAPELEKNHHIHTHTHTHTHTNDWGSGLSDTAPA
jgi:hypothetical protein